MIRISKKSQYGVRAMVQLARIYKDGKVCSVKFISDREGIPFDFLEKIILQLEKEKLVESKKGVLGGYMLSRPPKKISANDIVSALEENRKPVNCAFCGRKSKCSAKNVWGRLEKALNNTLEKITLAELIR